MQRSTSVLRESISINLLANSSAPAHVAGRPNSVSILRLLTDAASAASASHRTDTTTEKVYLVNIDASLISYKRKANIHVIITSITTHEVNAPLRRKSMMMLYEATQSVDRAAHSSL